MARTRNGIRRYREQNPRLRQDSDDYDYESDCDSPLPNENTSALQGVASTNLSHGSTFQGLNQEEEEKSAHNATNSTLPSASSTGDATTSSLPRAVRTTGHEEEDTLRNLIERLNQESRGRELRMEIRMQKQISDLQAQLLIAHQDRGKCEIPKTFAKFNGNGSGLNPWFNRIQTTFYDETKSLLHEIITFTN